MIVSVVRKYSLGIEILLHRPQRRHSILLITRTVAGCVFGSNTYVFFVSVCLRKLIFHRTDLIINSILVSDIDAVCAFPQKLADVLFTYRSTMYW